MFTFKGNINKTTKYTLIWLQNVHFVKTLPVPLLKILFLCLKVNFNQGLDEEVTCYR